MAEPSPQKAPDLQKRGDGPSLSPGVRRHLGRSLRSFYADALAQPVPEPVSERLDALLAKLGAQG